MQLEISRGTLHNFLLETGLFNSSIDNAGRVVYGLESGNNSHCCSGRRAVIPSAALVREFGYGQKKNLDETITAYLKCALKD